MNFRQLIHTAIVLAGVATIFGSGSGGGCSGQNLCIDNCPIGPINFALFTVDISQRQTAQVGTAAVFTPVINGSINGIPTYTWCRAPSAVDQCVTITSAVESSYTIASVSSADDGAYFAVSVKDSNGGVLSGRTRLSVASSAAVSFQDGDFPDADWTATPVIPATTPSSAYGVETHADGGNPGTYRKVAYDVFNGAQLKIFHSKLSATYDPATRGEIYTIDFANDCIAFDQVRQVSVQPLVEQAGRRFTSTNSWGADGNGCLTSFVSPATSASWRAVTRPSLGREDFVQVDGPACGATETCPDFSRAGAPLRFGLMTFASGSSGFHHEQGFDNFKVRVWPK